MKKRRSFFLLEVMIALILVGVFSYVSLQGFYHSIHQQKKMIRALQYAWHSDLKRMGIIETYWNRVEELATGQKVISVAKEFEVSCCKHGDQYYLLNVKEIRPKEFACKGTKSEVTYHYFRTL